MSRLALFVFSVPLFAGCPSTGPGDAPPEIVLLLPEVGAENIEGEPIALRAQVEDDEDAA